MVNREVISVLVLLVVLDNCSCGVSQWGDICNFTAECSDHRMVCTMDRLNISKCDCDRFHLWNGTANGCIEVFDIEAILNMTITSRDNQALLEKYQQHIYFGHKLAGFFVMSVACICPIAVAIHCFHMKRKDRILKRDLKEIRARVDSAKEMNSHHHRGDRIV